MFLKEIANRPAEGMMSIAFKKLGENGHAVPEIMHLFRFKQRSTDFLIRFTDEVMRGPSPLSTGLRELIGSYVSKRNQCSFCSCAHAPVAAQLLGKEIVDEVLTDLESARISSAEKELLRYVGKVAENASGITADDVERVKEAGWSEEAIYDALTVASLFKFYNTWNNGSGVQNMSAGSYMGSAERLLEMGYCMDFSFRSLIRVVWVGRKEINASDLKALFRITLQKVLGVVGLSLKPRAIQPYAPAKSAPMTPGMFTELEKGF
ncbi:MAG TPA: hypothetical protein VF773_11760 [Verrucomicrobiae bacterium]